jgi:hypothetical protein
VVATGLVDGVSASTTPAGRGTSTILARSSTRGVTKSSPAYSSSSPTEQARFLRTLCSTTPKVVSRTAHSAYSSAFAAAASATARTMRSTDALL